MLTMNAFNPPQHGSEEMFTEDTYLAEHSQHDTVFMTLQNLKKKCNLNCSLENASDSTQHDQEYTFNDVFFFLRNTQTSWQFITDNIDVYKIFLHMHQ